MTELFAGPFATTIAPDEISYELGSQTGGHLENHRAALAGRVVILLDAVHHSLAGRVIDYPFPANGVRDRADRIAAELQLGKDHELRSARMGDGDGLANAPRIRFDLTEPAVQLREGDPHGRHDTSAVAYG